MKLRVSITALLAVAVLTVGAPQAEAVLLLPDQTVGQDSIVFPGGTELASVEHQNQTLGPVTATLRSAVYRNAEGTLDFYYQARNESASNVLNRLTAWNFAGFTTDVFNVLNGSAVGCSACIGGFFADGTENYITATRSADAETVGFEFPGTTSDSPAIGPGETTVVLLIRTNATHYVPGLMSVIDGATITRPAFAPGVVPEPASLMLFGLGLLGSAAMVRRRRRD